MKISKLLNIILPVISAIIVLWLYFPALKGHFNWEDGMILGDAVQALTKGKIGYIFQPWYGSYARFFLQIISVVLYKIFGYNSLPFLAISLFFHILNSFLTYLLAEKLTKSKLIAFFSSLLYGVYQINFEGLTWIFSGIKDVPMTTFFILSYLCFIKYLEKKKLFQILICYFFFTISLSCEFKAFFIPLVFVVHELLFDTKKIFLLKNFKKILKYLPLLFIEVAFLKLWYSDTPKLLYDAFDWQNAVMTFFASLPFYIIPISRIFWTKVYTNAHGLTTNHSDELYLKELGVWIFIIITAAIVFLLSRKEREKAKILILLVLSTLINYLPVLFTVLSKYHTLWAVLTVHWRYFTLASPLAAILITSSAVWTNYAITKLFPPNNFFLKLIKLPLKLYLLPTIFLVIIIFFHIESDRLMLNNSYLKWTVPAKKLFADFKRIYPSFPKESVLVIEGVENELRLPYLKHRYLLENLFPLYAIPNNSDYQIEQRKISLDPQEGYLRPLDRLLFYTNLKDILVGRHQHLYQNGKSKMIASNIPIGLTAVDRLFLGTIYGLYNPEKVYVFSLNENGEVSQKTEERRKQVIQFIEYFCFKNGQKTCWTIKNKAVFPLSIKKTFDLFSKDGKTAIENLISLPKGPLPYPYRKDI